MAHTVLDEKNPLNHLRKRYITWSVLLFFAGVIILLWNVLVVIGVYNLNLGYRWAILSMSEWMYAGWIIFSLFIMIELVFFAQYYKQLQNQMVPSSYDDLTFKGKKLLVYTFPSEAHGGVFSKTHVQVDKDTIVNIRVQLIREEDV